MNPVLLIFIVLNSYLLGVKTPEVIRQQRRIAAAQRAHRRPRPPRAAAQFGAIDATGVCFPGQLPQECRGGRP